MTSLGVDYELLRESVRSFAEPEIVPFLEEWERAGEVPRELHRKAADAGLLTVDFPEEVGGAAGDFLHLLVVTEERKAAHLDPHQTEARRWPRRSLDRWTPGPRLRHI